VTALRQPDACWKPSESAARVLDAVGWDLDKHIPSRPRCSERDAALLDLIVSEDVTLNEVGLRLGLTRERVRQILQKHTGLSTRDLEESRVVVREMRWRMVARADLARIGGVTIDEVVDVLGVDDALVRRGRNTWTQALTDEEILEGLRQVSACPGGTPLTGPFYDAHRDPDTTVSAIRVFQRFGSWTAACTQAGVTFKAAVRDNYERRWTDEQCIDWAVLFVEEVGATATFAGMEDWMRRRSGDGAPSGQSIRNYLGTWIDILELVALRRHELKTGAEPTVRLPQGQGSGF
jgi:hypothetical protein